jgi:hypothetical protein
MSVLEQKKYILHINFIRKNSMILLSDFYF